VELAAEGASGLDEERLVDRLVRHLHLPVSRMLEPEAGRDLLGRPAYAETTFHLGPQAGIPGELGEPRSAGPSERTGLRPPGPIAPPAAVPGDLPRDRRGGAAEASGDDPQGGPETELAADLLPLSRRQPERRALPAAGRKAARRSHQEADGLGRRADCSRGHSIRLTGSDEPADLEALGDAQSPPEVSVSMVHPSASTRSVLPRLLVVDVASFT